MLRTKLHGKVYHADIAAVWTREIADEIKHQLKEKKYPRYKYAVQVVLGEQKGEGVKCAARRPASPPARKQEDSPEKPTQR